MTAIHPDPSLLKRFLRGELGADERKGVVRHLISGCVACRSLAGDLWQAAEEGQGHDPEPASGDYQHAMERAVRLARERRPALAAARAKTPELLAELLAATSRGRLALAESDPKFRTPSLCEALLARRAESSPSWLDERVGDHPDPDLRNATEPRELADLALILAGKLDAAEWGTPIVRDLEARAWAHRGDAARQAGRLDEAQRAFRMAHSLYGLSSQDPWDWAEISRYEARFELARGQAEAATALSLESVALYRKLGERALLSATLGEAAPMALRARRPDLAIDALAEAVELIDPSREPLRLAGCLHSLGSLLIRTERAREALGHLWRARSLYERLREPEEVLRVRWSEGRAALAIGSLAEGEEALLAVREHLLAAGLGQDAAGVLLDLVELYLRQGRKQEMHELFTEMIFLPYRTRDLERGTVAALLMLRRAVETESASTELVCELANYLAAGRPIGRPV